MALSLQDILDKGKKQSQGLKQRTAKPRPGRTVWRILPGWDAAEPFRFFHAYGQHFIKDMDGKIKVVLGCPDKTHEEPCEVCEAISDAARAAPDDKTREKIMDSKSTQRFLFNAIDIDNDPKKVVILEVGQGLFRDILANIEEDNELIDADKGRDMIITREGSGLNTRYSLAVRSKDKSITVNKSMLMEMNDLTEYVAEDFEAMKKKALSAIGAATGTVMAGSGAAAALSAPDADLEMDEIPDFGADEVKKAAEAEIADAEVEYDTAGDDEKKDAEESYGADISEDDIESMLADL